jgi:hypothetical protein
MQIVFPRRNPLVPLIEVSKGVFTFGEFSTRLYLSDPQRHWLNNLSGDKSVEDALVRCGNDDERRSLQHIVDVGLRSAGLLDSNAMPNIARWTSKKWNMEAELTHIHLQEARKSALITPAEIMDRRRTCRVYVAGANYLGASIASLIPEAGFSRADSARTASVLVFPSVAHSLVGDQDFAERERLPHLHVGIRHTSAVVGPLVVPGFTSCLRCNYLHRRDQDPSWPAYFLGWRGALTQSTADQLLLRLAAAFSLSILRHWIDGNQPFNLAWRTSLPYPSFTEENRPPHPLCGCQLMLPYPDERITW